MIYLLITDRQTVNYYYSTIHALELIYFDSNTNIGFSNIYSILNGINGINVAETVDIVQLSTIALQISRQICDCNAGIYTQILRLLCAKTTFHRLTMLCGMADVTNAAKQRHA